MQVVTTILFTLLILGFLLLFLLPGRWWPRKPRRRIPPEISPIPHPEPPQESSAELPAEQGTDMPEPRRYTGYLN